MFSKTHSLLSLKESSFTEANRDCSSILFSSLRVTSLQGRDLISEKWNKENGDKKKENEVSSSIEQLETGKPVLQCHET
jgi:hypothetical protein